MLLPVLLAGNLSCGGESQQPPPPPPTATLAITAVPPDSCAAGEPIPNNIKARVVDVNNTPATPVAGVAVQFALTMGLGTLGATSATTDDGGFATVGFVCGPKSSYYSEGTLVQASVAGVGTVSYTIWVVPGPIDALVLLSGYDSMPLMTGTSVMVALQPQDRFGNPIKMMSFSWFVEAGGGSLDAAVTTISNGCGSETICNTWHLGAAAGVQTTRVTTRRLPRSPAAFLSGP